MWRSWIFDSVGIRSKDQKANRKDLSRRRLMRGLQIDAAWTALLANQNMPYLFN